MSFNLNTFISGCKQSLPKYLKELTASDLATSEINYHKRLIVTFLRDYFSYNNNKFNRSRFNLEFFKEFFSEILPNQHPEFLNSSFNELQSKLKDFFNYLSLQKVVERDLTKKILHSLDKEANLNQNYDDPLTLVKSAEEDLDEYSEEILDDTLVKCDGWFEEFIHTMLFENLSHEQKDHASSIIEAFFHYLYDYLLILPEDLDNDSLEEVCLDIFPRKISGDESFFKAVVPVLNNFFMFLNYRGIIHNAELLCKKLSQIQVDLLKAAKDPRNWGMAKSMIMDAVEAGVNVEDTEALNTYFNIKNLANLLEFSFTESDSQVKNLDFWDEDDLEALETNEIVERLKKWGIPFEEKKFLKETQQFYSVSDLCNKWIELPRVNVKGRDEDFVWWAIYVLWKRLAPETINLEQLDDMMQEGYDLIEENRYMEGCELWFQVWEHLKKKFRPEMKSIEDAEKTFEGSQSLYNWCGDFSEELYMAGKEDRAFFEKRLVFCREFIELFPETEDYYLACFKRDVADTYFLLDMDEEGEKVFQELVKNQPDYIFGYIAWGDQYSGLWNEIKRYNYEKAMFLYKMGLEKVNASHVKGMKDRLDEREMLLESIKDLEEKEKGVHFKQDLLEKYNMYLSQQNLSSEIVKKKIKYGEKFLDYIIFIKGMNDFNALPKMVNSETLLEFLGFWSILRIVKSKSALIDLIKATESCCNYIIENSSHNEKDEDLNKLKRIFVSTDFFIERFTSYHKNVLDPSKKKNKIQNLRAWKNDNKKWSEWIKINSKN